MTLEDAQKALDEALADHVKKGFGVLVENFGDIGVPGAPATESEALGRFHKWLTLGHTARQAAQPVIDKIFGGKSS